MATRRSVHKLEPRSAVRIASLFILILSTVGSGLRGADLSSRLGNWRAWGAGGDGQTGDPHFGQSEIPSQTFKVLDIAAGGYHNVALRNDGTVYCWGRNTEGQCDAPLDLSGVKQVTAGHLHSLARLTDGSLRHWGSPAYGLRPVPEEATNIVDVASGYSHCLALRADGKVIAWGHNGWGQTNVPPGLTAVVALAAGGTLSAVVEADGRVEAWGIAGAKPPVDLAPVRAIACGNTHVVALLRDGTVRAWGNEAAGTATVVPPELTDVIEVGAGVGWSIALKSDGSLIAWGEGEAPTTPLYGQTDIPANLGPVRRIRAGHFHAVAEKGRPDGLVARYRLDASGINDIPGGPGTIAISGGGTYVTNRFGIAKDALQVARGVGFGGTLNGLVMPNPDYTVSVWARLPLLSEIPTPLGTRILDQTWPGGNFVLGLNPDGTVYFMTALDAQAYPSVRPTLGDWHHIVCAYEDRELKLYIDGVLVAVDTATRSNPNQGYPLYLGTNDKNIPFSGQLDDLRIFERGLMAVEVQALYNLERTPPQPRNAAATVDVANGVVVGWHLTDGGFGYTSPPVVTVIGGGGTGAIAIALLNPYGIVFGITITDAGAGYTSAPLLTIAPPPPPQPPAVLPHPAVGVASVKNGFVVEVEVTDSGFGYTDSPIVLLIGGGGTGATAAARVSNGIVTQIDITSAGNGYTEIPVVRVASPPFSPFLSIATSKVKVTQNVMLGRKYVLESSKDLLGWVPVGQPFVAVEESTVVELDVDVVGQFFRIRQVP